MWREHELLLVEKRQLDDRFRVLDAISAEVTEDTASESGADDAEAVEGEAVAAAVAKPATAVPAQPSQLPAQTSQQLNLRPGEGDARAQPRRAVLEVTTFEIGMLPECGR